MKNKTSMRPRSLTTLCTFLAGVYLICSPLNAFAMGTFLLSGTVAKEGDPTAPITGAKLCIKGSDLPTDTQVLAGPEPLKSA